MQENPQDKEKTGIEREKDLKNLLTQLREKILENWPYFKTLSQENFFKGIIEVLESQDASKSGSIQITFNNKSIKLTRYSNDESLLVDFIDAKKQEERIFSAYENNNSIGMYASKEQVELVQKLIEDLLRKRDEKTKQQTESIQSMAMDLLKDLDEKKKQD